METCACKTREHARRHTDKNANTHTQDRVVSFAVRTGSAHISIHFPFLLILSGRTQVQVSGYAQDRPSVRQRLTHMQAEVSISTTCPCIVVRKPGHTKQANSTINCLSWPTGSQSKSQPPVEAQVFSLKTSWNVVVQQPETSLNYVSACYTLLCLITAPSPWTDSHLHTLLMYFLIWTYLSMASFCSSLLLNQYDGLIYWRISRK